MSDLSAYILPAAALVLGTLVFALTKYQSRAYDREHKTNRSREAHVE